MMAWCTSGLFGIEVGADDVRVLTKVGIDQRAVVVVGRAVNGLRGVGVGCLQGDDLCALQLRECLCGALDGRR